MASLLCYQNDTKFEMYLSYVAPMHGILQIATMKVRNID